MENTTQPSGQTDLAGSTEQKTQTDDRIASSEDTVAYSTHKKLLAEKKNLQAKYEEIEKKFNSIHEEKLQNEGKKDELLEAYKQKINDYESKFSNFAFSTVANNVALEAKEMGCVDHDALIKLVDLSSLNVGDNFAVDKDEVKTMLENVKKEKPYLFKKEAPKVHDGVVKKAEAPMGYAEELAAAKTQVELEAVLRKHGRI